MSRARFLGRPIHPMLIVFPRGLLGTAPVFDLLALVLEDGYWSDVALWMIIAGVLGGLVAAPFGLMDWLEVPADTRAKRLGALHGIGNTVVLAVFTASAWLHWTIPRTRATLALLFVFSLVGLIVSLVPAWMGAELVGRLGVGVDQGAHVDAPSSLPNPLKSRDDDD